jgi:diadenosine tetraphosphate (Ap4A) HIT family hydrolase
MSTLSNMHACPLCETDGGRLVLRMPDWRAVGVEGAEGERFPGFYRLIWNSHVAEFSDLSAEQRLACMEAVTAIEQLLREQLRPVKINLASLGNAVPHLHWHVIPRWSDDSHFPNPVWAQAVREVPARRVDLARLDEALRQRLSTATR